MALKPRGDGTSQCGSVALVHRLKPTNLDQRSQRWTQLKETTEASRRRFTDDHQASRGHGRENLIENAGGLALMRAALRELDEVPDKPNQPFARVEFLDQPLDAPFQLTDVDLVCHEFGATGFEHRPAIAPQSCANELDEGRLSDVRLTGDEQRSWRVVERGCLRVIQLLTPDDRLHKQFLLAVFDPEAAKGREIFPIDSARLPAPQLFQQGGRKR